MVFREFWKRLNFDHNTTWYTHKPEYVLDNVMYKILWDFEIQTDHQIQARRPDLVVIKKKKKERKGKSRLVHFAISVDHGIKIK